MRKTGHMHDLQKFLTFFIFQGKFKMKTKNISEKNKGKDTVIVISRLFKTLNIGLADKDW